MATSQYTHQTPRYLGAFQPNRGPNYKGPALVGRSDLGGLMRGCSFATTGVPTGSNFTAKGSVYDGYESFAEATMGAETTAWMKASTRPRAAQQLEQSRMVADAVGDKRVYLNTPYASAVNHEFKPRNAWVVPNHAAAPADAIYPTREPGKYLVRPEVPEVYQATFPHLFDTERVDPMFNPYWFPEAALHRHYQGHPTMPLPPLGGGEGMELATAANTDEAPLDYGMERPIFGDGNDWWKWKVVSSDPVDYPKLLTFREHEDGYGIFKGQLTANLPNGNSTEGDLDGFALARSCETLLDLTSLGGVEIAVRGDGKQYSMVLGMGEPGFSSVQYVCKIPKKPTTHKWRVIRIPWAAFVPYFKDGREAPGAPPMQGMVSWMGFAIGDRQWGPFTMEVAYVKAVY